MPSQPTAHLVVHLRDNVTHSAGHTEYVVDCTLAGQHWTVHKRFSAFATLHKSLQVAFPGLTLPAMPAKAWFGNMGSKWIEQRKAQLNMMIDALLRLDDVASHAAFTSFFGVPEQAAKPFYASESEDDQQGDDNEEEEDQVEAKLGDQVRQHGTHN